MNNLNLPDDIMASLCKVYGEMPNHIGITKTRYPNIFELNIKFYLVMRIPDDIENIEDNIEIQNVHQLCVHQLCSVIEKLVYNKSSNVKPPAFIPGMHIEFHVSPNVPDGIVHISPKTYYEMFGEIYEMGIIK